MGTRNNFDTSSTGIDVTVTAYYDSDSSQRDFDENTRRLKDSVFVFTDWGQFNPKTLGDVFTIPNTVKKEELFDFAEEFGITCKYSVEDYTKDELINDIKNAGLEIFSYSDLSHVENYPLKIRKGIKIETTFGYSQGGSCYVIAQDEMSDEYIRNVFWDAPLRCHVTVNDEDFYIDEYVDNLYEWDRDEAIEIVRTKFNLTKEQQDEIIALLPERLEYS